MPATTSTILSSICRTTIVGVAMSVGVAGEAAAAPTAEQKCQTAKLDALRKRTFCLAGERRREVIGQPSDTAPCHAKFDKAIAKANEAAARRDTACRWLDNGDGTATDLDSGLIWEIKTDDGGVHDKDNVYTWTTVPDGTIPDGSAFVSFLGTLNRAVAAGNSSGTGCYGFNQDQCFSTGCFAGKCDWRLPTIEELWSIVDRTYPACAVPCTTIPGFTEQQFYWSSSTWSPTPTSYEGFAWAFAFFGPYSLNVQKTQAIRVRAVRDGF